MTLPVVTIVVVAVGIGFALGWALARARAATERLGLSSRHDARLAVAEDRIARAEALAAEQKAFVEGSKREMENAFRALANDALRGSTDEFLKLAEERLSKTRVEAGADLDARRQAIAHLLEPVREALGRLEGRTAEIERAREGAYTKLEEHIRLLAEETGRLQQRTTSLDTALRGSQVRGRWGEIALRNIVELAGMTEHCDFTEQETTDDGGRPDLTVRLPGGRFLAVDSKAPLSAYIEAHEATSDSERNAALDRHVAAVRGHVKALASRGYAASLGDELDLVVMFLPGDPYLAAAFERSPDLQTEALRRKVLIATPTTLVALLRTVAIYWQQRSMAENAEHIARTARDLYERGAKFAEDLSKLGKALDTALIAYNRAVGSFDNRFIPMARRLEGMKVTDQSRRKLNAPGRVDSAPRDVQSALPFSEGRERLSER